MTRPQRSVALRQKQTRHRLVMADAYRLAHDLIRVGEEIAELLPDLNRVGDEGAIPDPPPDDFDFGASLEGACYDFAGSLGNMFHEDLSTAAERFLGAFRRLAEA